MDTGGGMNWEIGIDMYTPIWITNKNLLYKKLNKIKFKNSKKKKKIVGETIIHKKKPKNPLCFLLFIIYLEKNCSLSKRKLHHLSLKIH